MLRKILILVIIILFSSSCLLSCSLLNAEIDSICNTLNSLTRQYSTVYLSITTITDGIELSSHYQLNNELITYSIEIMNTFNDCTNFETNDNYKKTVEGKASIQNNTIANIDGDFTELPPIEQLTGAFYFNSSYFSNINNQPGIFEAEIINVSDFFGTNTSINNAILRVEYDASRIKLMRVNYSLQDAYVTLDYIFN